MRVKLLISIMLFVFATASIAGGDNNRKGAPEDNWLGDSNTDDTQRALVVKCPENTTPGAVDFLPDEEGAVIVVECNYDN
ncbi:hypothetical protein [Thiocapsa roseopersicina]|uniref:Uncharacterized protein n=1 Tax=Thiocapsa roseopersicina TaxID=1058 RepID=A0A1H3C662_THIRO|nr:hypothetical protein [Thiocapsa roseopersicina]SDX49114.1 hypothetical protein SAMN05421783_13020 [Thiocapsa roseopersicina]